MVSGSRSPIPARPSAISSIKPTCDLQPSIGGSVVRNNAEVHDDLDISYHLRPEMAVIYDPALVMGVSARPLTSWPSFRRHIRMSLVTFRVEFKEEPPLRRRLERARARRSLKAQRRRAGTDDGG